jgi:hypothetical protein
MHGEPGAVLDPMGLALWALKTAFTLTLATDPPIGRVPRLHGRWPEKEQGRLPPGVSVLLHRSAEVGWWFSSVSTAIVEVAGDDPRLNLDGQRRNAYCYFLHLGRALLIVRYWPDNRSVLTYDHARFELLGTGATAVAAPADAPPGQRDPLFDLMMAMRIRMDLSGRRPTDFCLCGSGVAAALCAGADHKIDQAGNWGWMTGSCGLRGSPKGRSSPLASEPECPEAGVVPMSASGAKPPKRKCLGQSAEIEQAGGGDAAELQ